MYEKGVNVLEKILLPVSSFLTLFAEISLQPLLDNSIYLRGELKNLNIGKKF